jgi:O-antigen ligase
VLEPEHRTRRGRGVLVAAALAAGGVAAVGAAVALGSPWLAPILLGALIACPFLVVRPVACLILLTVVEAANLPAVAVRNGLPGVYIVVLAVGAAAVCAAARRGELRASWSPLFLVALLVLGAQAVSGLAGANVGASLAAVGETAKAGVWLVLLVHLLLTRRDAPGAVVRAFVLTLAVLCALGLVQEYLLGNSTTFLTLSNVPLDMDPGAVTARHSGPQNDVNFWGRVLVLGLPFGFALVQQASSLRGRALWAGATLAICAGLVLTGSRGGLLAAFVVTCSWALLLGGRYRRALWLAPVVIALALVIPGVGSRLATLSALTGDGGVVPTEASLEGRIAAQRVAVEMTVDHPALGVGPGNFIAIEPEYLRSLGLDAIGLAPHNLYLEASAEGGLLGLAALVLLLGTAIVLAYRARVVARWAPDVVGTASPLPLANATVAALVGWCAASVFLHQATFRTFLLVAALAVAMDVRARRAVTAAGLVMPWEVMAPPAAARAGRDRTRGGSEAAAPLSGRPRRRTAMVTGLVVAVLLAVGGVIALAPLRGADVWGTSASFRLVVKDGGQTDSRPYELDALTRTGLVRTFATITVSPRFEREALEERGEPRSTDVDVTVSNVPTSGLIVVKASSRNAGEAQAAAVAVRSAAISYINSLSVLYGVEPVPGLPTSRSSPPLVDPRLALLPIGMAGFLCFRLWRSRRAMAVTSSGP